MSFQWAYLSRTPGIGGEIKFSPESFLVEEITPAGEVLEINRKTEQEGEVGDYTHFVLQKRDWSTAGAIRAISKKLRIGQGRFDYAGTKDKTGITTQLVSAFRVDAPILLSLSIKDIRINGAWPAKEKVRMGSLLGNRFTIEWRGEGNPEEGVEKTHAELKGKFPNYFGPQRFGTTRKNTHIVGELMAKRRFQEAATAFLCDSAGEEHEQASAARTELRKTMDFSRALKEFPKHLRLERAMLHHLSQHPNDFINAFRRLPRPILLLFVHAFQSYLFNELLSERIEEGPLVPEEGEGMCGTSPLGFPDPASPGDDWIVGRIIGYETPPNEREKRILEKHEVSPADFKLPQLPEISSKGTLRMLLAPYPHFSFSENTFRFSLPSGCYATSLLREFMKIT